MVQRIMVKVWTVQSSEAVGNQNGEEASPWMNEESIAAKSADCCEHTRTRDEITLLYITCNPDTLVANAIVLCTRRRRTRRRTRRNMSSTGPAWSPLSPREPWLWTCSPTHLALRDGDALREVKTELLFRSLIPVEDPRRNFLRSVL